ncbi:MAG: hypothetical protein V7K92_00770 [Nostoc sp.]|uniref:hypothetical protein n=1 Tax=Nostoc sp. TaxID=1180 RepID=UPI002FEFBFFD
MGFIKKSISGIQGFLSGILGFITGLLPGKKKSNGYFLELDEAKDAVTDVAKDVASNVKKVAETVGANAKKVTASIGSEAPDPSKPDSLNGTKTAASKGKGKSAKNPKPADVTLVQTAEGLKVEPGKNAKAAAAKVLKEESKETTFAPKYLAPSASSSNGRRRPGANMSAYLDMARQVKKPG